MPGDTDALELDSRKRIFEHVRDHPGLHMRELGRALDMAMGTLEYHLNYMRKAGLLVTREDGRYTRFFAEGEVDRRDKDVLAVLRQKTPRQIAAHLLLHPDATHGDIHTQFKMSASTLSFHLKKLVSAEIAEQQKVGRENRYRICDPDLVARVLITHKASFVDDVVDRFAGVWLRLEPRPEATAAGDSPPGGGLLMVFATALARSVAFA